MKSKKYNRSFARRLSWWVMLVLFIMMSGLGFLIYHLTKSVIVEVSADRFHGNMQSSDVTIGNVMSDVSVAVINNVNYVEDRLGQPDQIQAIMERIVEQNPRIRSCGISFIENYYPQKGRAFCPYMCRDSVNPDNQPVVGLTDDYLEQEWFREAISADSAFWSKPFFDGRYAQTPLIAYMHPIHDRQGRTVAIMGADLSLDFMTRQLQEQDSIFNEDTWAIPMSVDKVFSSYVLARDGTYITHPEHRRILKGNFYDHIKDADVQGLAREAIKYMSAGKKSDNETDKVVLVNRVKTYLFYEPINGTDWMLALSVPIMSLDLIGILVGILMVLLIAFMLLVTFFVCRHAIKRVAMPLKQLAATADEVADGQFNTALPTIKSRDEIHLLRDSFENMQHSLATYVEELKNATAAKASMESELKIAHDIQMSMLPKTYPAFPDRHDIDIYGVVMPAKAVGGDLYDFFIRDEKLFFCIGDVSGKGVPASLVMAVTRSLFRNISAYTQEPSHIMIALNEALSSNNEAGMFVTLCIGVLDLSSGLMNYSNAGHNPPLLLADSDVKILPCDPNIPAGVLPEWQYTDQHLQLKTGDSLFLYTDGLNEAEDDHHNQFGLDRMLQVAQFASNQPQRLIEAMTTSVKLFMGNAEQSDDLTMLAIQYTLNL